MTKYYANIKNIDVYKNMESYTLEHEYCHLWG